MTNETPVKKASAGVEIRPRRGSFFGSSAGVEKTSAGVKPRQQIAPWTWKHMKYELDTNRFDVI